MATLEGVDYSSTANADWAGLARSLKAAGKHFVGRYAVNDKSPNGRGITAAEYQAMTGAGIGVFLYWESSEGWMTAGFDAGVYAAQNAQQNIVGAGMPVDTPVYFACDFDAAESDQPSIDDCLRGATSVLGFPRVGLYAGYYPLLRAKQNGTARWFCQTSAWSGGQLMAGVHLYQYDYNQYVYGTNCDWVRAYADNYGQAHPPMPLPEVPKEVTLPEGIDWDLVSKYFGTGDLYRPGKPAGKFKLHKGRPWAKAYLDRAIKEQVWPQVDAWHQYKDAPTATREIITFRNGWTLMRLNDRSPWTWV